MEQEHEVDALESEMLHMMLDWSRNQPEKFIDLCRMLKVNAHEFAQFLEQDVKSRQH